MYYQNSSKHFFPFGAAMSQNKCQLFCHCSQNGQHVPPELRGLGFKFGIFQNEVWVGVPKTPV